MLEQVDQGSTKEETALAEALWAAVTVTQEKPEVPAAAEVAALRDPAAEARCL